MSKVIIQNVRCSYVFLREPRKAKDEKGRDTYSIQLIIPKDHPQIGQIKNAIKVVAEENFKGKKLTMLKHPLRDGDKERDTPEYENTYFINANGGRKPGIVNRNNEPADNDDLDELCYSGAYFHVSVNFYAFDTDGNKGIAAGLNNVMLVKKGDRLDGMTAATEEFKDFATDDFADEGEDDFDDL